MHSKKSNDLAIAARTSNTRAIFKAGRSTLCKIDSNQNHFPFERKNCPQNWRSTVMIPEKNKNLVLESDRRS